MARWMRLFQKRHRDEELEREIEFHIEELTQTNLANGMAPTEARRQAVIAFGGREQAKQGLRDVHSSPFVERVSFNMKAAIRFIRRAPSFSATVILILAIGIGTNSAVFSAIDAVILRPPPSLMGTNLSSFISTTRRIETRINLSHPCIWRSGTGLTPPSRRSVVITWMTFPKFPARFPKR